MPITVRKVLVTNSANEVAGATATAIVPLDLHSTPFNVAFAVANLSTRQYRIQHTFDNVFDSSITPRWFTHSNVTAQQLDTDGNYAFPVNAIRMQLASAATSGRTSAVLYVNQAGI